MLGKRGPPRHFPLCVSLIWPCSRDPVLVSAWMTEITNGTRARKTQLKAIKSQFADVSRPPAHTPTPLILWNYKTVSFLSRTVSLAPRTIPIEEQSCRNQSSTGGIAWAIGVGGRNSSILFPQLLKFTAVRPLRSKVSHSRAAGGGCSIHPGLCLIFGHSL